MDQEKRVQRRRSSVRSGTSDRMSISMMFEGTEARPLQRLPWYKPLSAWTSRDANFIPVRSGISRHVVRFIRLRRSAFAVKETSGEAAGREVDTYLRLRSLGVPTLIPVGTVYRIDGLVPVNTAVGIQAETHATGYVVTRLLEYSIPNYFLFRRQFQKINRKRIWDAIITLFVGLHIKNIFWGDASLSNMMIVFAKERFPEIGNRTVLRAVLADAETVEFHPTLSESMRLTDLSNFLESIAWAEEDLRRSGTSPDPMIAAGDQRYILQRYRDLFEIEHEEKWFAMITNMDVDRLLGTFQEPGQSRALLQHIYEHKWYLSERRGREVPVDEAARDWYVHVFKPVLKLFAEYDILHDFPDSTAASLYLDIMLHKYYLSQQFGSDVGLTAAFESYSRKSGRRIESAEKMTELLRSMKKLFDR